MITLAHVTCQYRGVTAVEDVSGVFAPGSMTAIIGPNGAGKTTLLRAIAGVHPPASGTIAKIGLTQTQLAQTQIALLPQAGRMERGFPISCADVVALGAIPHIGVFAGLPADAAARVAAALVRVGLAGLERRLVGTLSAGQFQRVLWARLLVQGAEVILLDEPTANVDATSEAVFRDMLADWQRAGRTVIAVLHDIDLVRAMFPNTVMLARRLIAWGPTDTVLSPENRRAARLAIDPWLDAA